MIGVVISLNIAIALFCLFVVWRVWRLKRTLAKVADILRHWENSTHHTLYRAPDHILGAQEGVSHLRKQQAQLRFRLQQVQQVLGLVFLLQRFLLPRSHWFNLSSSKTLPKRLNGRSPTYPLS